MQILQIGFMSLLATSTILGIGVERGQNSNIGNETPIVGEMSIQWTESDTVGIIRAKAVEYGVDPALMLDIVECETGNDIASTTIQSRYVLNGKRERSYGLVQLNLDHNPDVTYEQAIDPVFSIDFLAHQLQHNRAYLWSCYKLVR